MKRPELAEYGLNDQDVFAIRTFDSILKKQEQLKEAIRSPRFCNAGGGCFVGLFGIIFWLLKSGDFNFSLTVNLGFLLFCFGYFSMEVWGNASDQTNRKNIISKIGKSINTTSLSIILIVFLLALYTTGEVFLSSAIGIVCGFMPYPFRLGIAIYTLCFQKDPKEYLVKKEKYNQYLKREQEYQDFSRKQKQEEQEQRIKAKEKAREIAARAAQETEKNKRLARKHLEFWQELDGVEFEQELSTLLQDSGYKNVSLTAKSGDDGIDLWAHDPDGDPCIFQCKAYQNTVSPAQVRELLGSLKAVEDKANYAVMVALSGVTGGAKKFAEKNKIFIWDGDKLVKMAEELLNRS